MTRLLAAVLISSSAAKEAQEPVPHPHDALGFTPGDDYRLADTNNTVVALNRLLSRGIAVIRAV